MGQKLASRPVSLAHFDALLGFMRCSLWNDKVRQTLKMLSACGLILLLIGCNAPGGQTTTSGGVTLVVAPDHAQQGDMITLSGQAWHPSSKITLAFSLTSQQNNDAASLGTATADAQGQFTFVTIVPQAAKPGVWSIIVQGDVGQSASAFFTVEAGKATATSMTTETPVSTIIIATDTPQPTAAPTSAPTDTPQPVVNTNEPSSAPTLQVTWNGDQLQLSGGDWPAQEQVTISLSKTKDGKNATSLGELASNDQGQFSVSVAVPRQVRENWFVIASDASHRVITRITKANGD
jgi:microcompartment protein CcmL/EutN